MTLTLVEEEEALLEHGVALMWVNKAVQETETMMTQEEEMFKDHSQEITLEEEEEIFFTERTTTMTIPTERTMSIAMITTMTMGTTHLNPRSSVLPRILSVKKKRIRKLLL